jgi:hypothetical protein
MLAERECEFEEMNLIEEDLSIALPYRSLSVSGNSLGQTGNPGFFPIGSPLRWRGSLPVAKGTIEGVCIFVTQLESHLIDLYSRLGQVFSHEFLAYPQ